MHGVNDNAARITAADWFNTRHSLGLGRSDKAWIGQWDHGSGCCPNRRGIQWTYALHAWFDQWLARRDVSTGPKVEVFMSEGSFGEAVSEADLNRDGLTDLVVSAPERTSDPAEDAGRVYVIFGASGGYGTGARTIVLRPGTSAFHPASVSTRTSLTGARRACSRRNSTSAARHRKPLPDNSDGLPSALTNFICAVPSGAIV